MQKIEFIMGMPIIVDPGETQVFDYFREIDERFSSYKKNSEVTAINDGRLKIKNASRDMKLILKLAEETRKETGGYFDVYHNNYLDPSGIVKGWAIYEASKILDKKGTKKYYINAGGDIQTKGGPWTVGIRNPFKTNENVKIVYLNGEGIATSGTYEKGNHIYDPHSMNSNFENSFLRSRQTSWPVTSFSGNSHKDVGSIVSITVIGKNVYEADRFATAAFAMGKNGINFIEKQDGLEGYMIDVDGIGTMTSGFEKYVEARG